MTDSARAVIRSAHNHSDNIMLDAACKQVLAIKGVLAWILKDCVPEFADADVKEIAYQYIEGEPQVAVVGVSPDETGADIREYLSKLDPEKCLLEPYAGKCLSEAEAGKCLSVTENVAVKVIPITEGEIISGMNTEFISTEEGKVTFDIFFRARTPKSGNLIRFYVEIEAQNDTTPGYPLTKRAFYNVCRVVSAQKGTEFANDDYAGIKKVYSIWICPQPAAGQKGTVTRYFPQEECVVGGTKERKENYDLYEIRMMYLPDADGKEGSGTLRMLDKLLSPRNSCEEKLACLKNDFGIPVTREEERKVEVMSGYSTIVMRAGQEQGMQKGKEEKARESAEKMHEHGDDVNYIADVVGYTADTVKKWLGLMPA